MNASNPYVRVAIVAAMLSFWACNDNNGTGPDDGDVKVTISKHAMTTGDTATASAVVFFADNSLAGSRWKVDLTVRGGTFDGDSVAVRRMTDGNGAVYLTVRGNSSDTLLIVTARSGVLSHADTAIVKAPAKP